MEQLDYKIANIRKMVTALENAINALEHPGDAKQIEYFQDSVVARFKILIESSWKLLNLYLELQEFSDVPTSPKGVVLYAQRHKFLTDEESALFLQCIHLRNLASHLYDQPQYLLAVHAAPEAATLVKALLDRVTHP